MKFHAPAVLLLASVLALLTSAVRAAAPFDPFTDPAFNKLAPMAQLEQLAARAAKKENVRDLRPAIYWSAICQMYETGKGDPNAELAAFGDLMAKSKSDGPLASLSSTFYDFQNMSVLAFEDALAANKDFQSADPVGKAKIISDLYTQKIAPPDYAAARIYVLMLDAQLDAAAKSPIADRGLARLKALKPFADACPVLCGQYRLQQIRWALIEHLVHATKWTTAAPADRIKILQDLRDQDLLGRRDGTASVYDEFAIPSVVALHHDEYAKLDNKGQMAFRAKLLADKTLTNAGMSYLMTPLTDPKWKYFDDVLTADKDYPKDSAGRVKYLRARVYALGGSHESQLELAMDTAIIDYLESGDAVTPTLELQRLEALGSIDKRPNTNLRSELFNGTWLREYLGFELLAAASADPEYKRNVMSRAVAVAKICKRPADADFILTPANYLVDVLKTQAVIESSAAAAAGKKGETRWHTCLDFKKKADLGSALDFGATNSAALNEFLYESPAYRDGTAAQKTAFLTKLFQSGISDHGTGWEGLWFSRQLEADPAFKALSTEKKKTAIEKMVTDKIFSNATAMELEQRLTEK